MCHNPSNNRTWVPALYSYIKEGEVFYCPADLYERSFTFDEELNTTSTADDVSFVVSFLVNRGIHKRNDKPIKRYTCEKPSQTVTIGPRGRDDNGNMYLGVESEKEWSNANDAWNKRIDFTRHGVNLPNNYLFVDGHVAGLTESVFFAGSKDPNSTNSDFRKFGYWTIWPEP